MAKNIFALESRHGSHVLKIGKLRTGQRREHAARLFQAEPTISSDYGLPALLTNRVLHLVGFARAAEVKADVATTSKPLGRERSD
jgi:hypothetical protein